jgi:hypothetical protein
VGRYDGWESNVSGIVYFSHSYRPRDAMVNDYFARLMEAEGLLASLDPPSTLVNSAKLERHLSHSDAMVVVLTERETGVSPHILYEISLGLRAGKPVLVFVEDTLPPDIVPAYVLQRRFSRRSFPRSLREHRQGLTILRGYLGDPAPRHQRLFGQRTCLLLGTNSFDTQLGAAVTAHLRTDRRYAIMTSADLIASLERHPIAYGLLREISLAIAFTGPALDLREVRLLGELQGASIPLIDFSTELSTRSPLVPAEYQPRLLEPGVELPDALELVCAEVEIYEEDFLELPDSASADRYTQFLIDLDGRGRYSARNRERAVEVVVGDTYEVHGQAGAVGPNSHVHDVRFQQVWNQRADDIDLAALAEELALLRSALRGQAITHDNDQVVADIGQAELAAKQGDGPSALRHLKKAGKWALDTAVAIGVNVAAAAIQAAASI